MREILTLSLPGEVIKIIKKRVIDRGFSSVSGYIKYLLDTDDDVISADKLLKMAKEAERDYKKGKVYKLESIADLMK
jgi:Arc/MetJ-type ribon-helix-helix transcriptional regulator